MERRVRNQARPCILLVEDESAVRHMLARVLRSQGYDLLVAADGNEAVALEDEEVASVDLLVSDLIMPGANGAEVAARLRARAPRLGVVFMSGYADHPVLQRVLETGERFIGKPFSIRHFTSVVHEALPRPAATR